jgi:hypothetical protein
MMLDPYISFCFLSVLTVFLAVFSSFESFKKYSALASVCVAFFYSIILGYRPSNFGTDNLAYMSVYDNATGLIDFRVSNNFEMGFNIWMSFFKQLGFGYNLFVFVSLFCSICIIIAYSRLFRLNSIFLVVVLVLSSTALGLYANGFRQGLSLSFVVAASYYLYVSRYFLFFFFGVFASFFHVATVPFVMVLLSAKIISRLSLGVSLVAFIVVSSVVLLIKINVELVLIFFEYLGITGKAYVRLNTYIDYDSVSRVGVGAFLSGLLILLSLYILYLHKGLDEFFVSGRAVRLSLLRYNFFICAISLVFYISFSSYGVLARIYSYSIFFEASLIYFVLFYFFKRSNFLNVIVVSVFLYAMVAKLLLPLYDFS